MSRPWMPLYVADYLADTGHLSAAEHGAYMLLLMHYWQTGGLPHDESKLRRIARMETGEWTDAVPTIRQLFGANWSHKRMDAELAKASAISSKRSDAARLMHERRNANANANAEQVHTQPQPQSQSLASSSFHSEEASQLAAGDLKMKCEEAAGQRFPKGFAKIEALVSEGFDPETRIIPVIRAVAAELRERKEIVSSWGYFVEAIRDPDREAVQAAQPMIWLAEDTPEFAAANRVLAALGQPVKRPMSIGSKPTRGAYFPPHSELLRQTAGAAA